MRPQTKKRGFTLVELTIAVTITVITGLSVAGATMALSRAHQDTEGFYQSLQTSRSAMTRIQRIVKGAKLIAACSGSVVVLWADDINGDGKINAEEVLLLVFDLASKEVRLYQQVFPAAVRTAMNVEVPLNDLTNPDHVVSDAVNSTYTQTTVVATDTSDFYAKASPNSPKAVRLDVRLSVGSGKNAVTLRSSASTRGGKASKVGNVDGYWYLND